VTTLLKEVEEDLVADQDPEVDPLTPEDIAAREPETRMLAAVGDYRHRLADQDYLVRVLTGQKRLPPRHRKRVVAVLAFALEVRNRWLDQHRSLERKVRQRDDEALAFVARNPEKLLLLQRYETRLERNIERKIRRLQQG
jgi:hypothetical protein